MEIPGYKILETLGKGGMATVYLAIQESFERKVAIKVMSPQLAQDPAFGDRFQREAKIVSQMNHPNIVTVYDVGVVDNHHYLAMQYVQGKELRARMKELSLMEKIRVTKEIASALNYAGNKGYVHRDVKPDNVMLSEEDGRGILMDFGIAKTSDNNHNMTKTGMAIGTPYYMSPEQAQGKPVDRRSDIYSLGIMFFQLLTGRVPYDAESQVAIGIKHITEPVPLLPKHLRSFQPIIDKVMAKEPASRYQTGAELIKDLDKISLTDLDDVDRIMQEEVTGTSRTDPHAATVMGEATAAPPVLNTGNVTTADAARLAKRLAAEPRESIKAEKTGSPLVALIVIILVLAAGGWFFTNQKADKDIQEQPIASVTTAPGAVSDALPQATVPTVIPEPLVSTEKNKKSDDSEKVAAEERQKQEKLAKVAAEEKQQQEELVRAAAEEKKHKASTEEKKRQELTRVAEQERQIEMTRFEAEQKRQQEIATRLSRAELLREQGQLVAPVNNNAIDAYRAVLEVDPGNAKARAAIKEVENSYLMGIRYQIDEGKLDEAALKLEEASKVFPNNATINELLALQQKKVAEIAAAKAEAGRPKITRLIVSDTAFESMQLAQKASLPMGRKAYFGISYQNFEGATSLLQAVLYDGSRALKITQKPVVVSGAQGTAFFTVDRPVEGFENGGYNLDLLMGEKKLISISFTVTH